MRDIKLWISPKFSIHMVQPMQAATPAHEDGTRLVVVSSLSQTLYEALDYPDEASLGAFYQEVKNILTPVFDGYLDGLPDNTSYEDVDGVILRVSNGAEANGVPFEMVLGIYMNDDDDDFGPTIFQAILSPDEVETFLKERDAEFVRKVQ